MPTIIEELPDLAPLAGVRFDERTPEGILLPNPDNSQRLDARRLAYSLIVIGKALSDLPTEGEVMAAITSAVTTAIANIVGGAPEALDELGEIAARIEAGEDAASALASLVASKASQSDLNALSSATNAAFAARDVTIGEKADELSVATRFASTRRRIFKSIQRYGG